MSHAGWDAFAGVVQCGRVKPNPQPLVHLCGEQDWDHARGAGYLRPDSLDAVGFVHLSAPEQVHLPANRLFVGRGDVLMLYLDPDLLGAPVRWEPGVPADPVSMLFPHLYGPLPVVAVTAVRPYPADADGRFPALAAESADYSARDG